MAESSFERESDELLLRVIVKEGVRLLVELSECEAVRGSVQDAVRNDRDTLCK